jgi:hypothetical protein
MTEETELKIIKKTYPLSISILDFTERFELKKRVIYFIIKITNNLNKKTFTIEKSFEDFEKFHNSLLILFSQVPSYPKKTLFKIVNHKLINKIKDQLENFLNDCIERKDILYSKEFFLFLNLNLNENFSEMKNNDIIEEGKIENLNFDIKDFIYDKSNQIIFICCSIDKNINLKGKPFLFSWEKKLEDKNKVLGEIDCYKINYTNEKKYEFDLLFKKEFFFRPKRIFYDNETQNFLIGFDNGDIIMYKIEENFSKMSELKNFHLDKEKENEIIENGKKEGIKGLVYNSNLNNIYFISSEKTFYSIDLNEEKIIKIKKNEYKYTTINFDLDKKRLFLTNEKGDIEIYNIINALTQILSIKTISGEKILNLQFSKDNKFFFVCDLNGKISMFNLREINNEKNINQIFCFGKKDRVNYIQINNINNNILSCDNKGRISIYDLNKKNDIYSLIAHSNLSIKKISYNEDNKILISSGKDNKIIFWKIPDKFLNIEIEEFEQKEEEKYKEEINKINILENEFNFEDDLNGWNLRKD